MYIYDILNIYDIIDKLIQLIPFKNPQAGAAGCLSPSQVEPSESAVGDCKTGDSNMLIYHDLPRKMREQYGNYW